MTKAIRNIAVGITALLTLAASSCHTSRGGASYNGNIDTTTANTADAAELFDQMAASYKPWQDLYVPVTLELQSPKRMSISGRATMIYGQGIYISLRMLGMEIGYIYLNESMAYVVDKFHKCYFAQDIADITSRYGIGITDLQNLLLGRAVVPGHGVISRNDVDRFSYLASDDEWLMTPVRTLDGADWHYIASRTVPPMLSAVSLRAKALGVMECRFSEPTETTAGIVDGVTTLTMPFKDDKLTVSITWSLNDAKWDTGRQINFTEPTSYRRLDMASLLKSMNE